MPRTATAFTNRSTPAGRGRTWVCRTATTSAQSAIHPKNPDIVYVAALGHLWGPNEMRGVYRTTDGGATWKQVLKRSNTAGAVDIAMDPSNPRVLYAALVGDQPQAVAHG